ncbi:hypothetical protein [Lentzea sp. CC55]|uniref:hypothetical protein n=1 Tax=Lentzea sp. CC55 TaxID=2884909 RepID=UPI001F436E67|nr:hypothetical protein [Lentzea sp. CC55]MCG8926617.1 hypothetical protein [Lentzea sp. CC55]
MSCRTCQSRRLNVGHEYSSLRRLVRMAVRNESPRNLALVAAAQAKVEDAKNTLAEHEAYCEVVA